MNKVFVLFLQQVLCAQWVVILVGSRGYMNYRHQADACHAYSALTRRGIPQSRIILFSFDDAAWSPLNPLPGTLFNAPSGLSPGRDVRHTCAVDFRGSQVTVDRFVQVMLAQTRPTFRHKYLTSNSQDHVFMYFVDHGSSEMLLFPSGEVFSASELHAMIELMKTRDKFKHMLIFVEACESGSLFENFALPASVLAVTAANATESSWGTYCPDFRSSDVVQAVPLNTCLGDLFSVNWIRALENSQTPETVQQFLVRVANATQKSEVNFYGDEALLELPVGSFLGSGQHSSFILALFCYVFLFFVVCTMMVVCGCVFVVF